SQGMQKATISQLPDLTGSTVELSGWLTGVRSSGKIAFLQLRDGTGFVQGVLVRSNVDDDTWARARALSQESSLIVQGTVRSDERSAGGVELEGSSLELLHASTDYPITPKEHGVDFLMERRHLYLRHKAPWAIM